MDNWKKRLGDDFKWALRTLADDDRLLAEETPESKRGRAPKPMSPTPKSIRISPEKRPLRPIYIDLTNDDDDGDEEASPVPVTPPAAAAATASTSASPLPQPQPERIRQDTLPDYSSFLQCRYADSPDWDWPEMLGMLTVNDLKDMAKTFFLRLAKKVSSSLDASFS